MARRDLRNKRTLPCLDSSALDYNARMSVTLALSPPSIRYSVAPMMDWTDRHCRYFHRLLAPEVRLYTEMVHAYAVIKGDRDKLLGYDQTEHPLALQLGGSDPAALAEAASIAEQYGYDEVNLNCGCPSDRVQAGRFGACLMREPGLVAECVASMSDRVSIPITVKCRLGVDDDENYDQFLHFVDLVTSAGSAMIVAHARNAWLKGLSPKENRQIPPLRYDWVYRLKQQRPQLPVVLNGGVDHVDSALQHLQHCDGVMVGRAAYHNPYLLHELNAQLFGSPLRTRAELLLAMRPYVENQLARGVHIKQMTHAILGLFHGQPGGKRFRQVLSENRVLPDWRLIELALQTTQFSEVDFVA